MRMQGEEVKKVAKEASEKVVIRRNVRRWLKRQEGDRGGRRRRRQKVG